MPVKQGWFERFVRKGYPKSWFTWIEALTLTVALVIVFSKAEGGFERTVIGAMALISFIFSYFIAIVGLGDFAADCLGRIRLPKWAAWSVAIVVTLIAMGLVLFAITAVILRSIG